MHRYLHSWAGCVAHHHTLKKGPERHIAHSAKSNVASADSAHTI